MIKLIIVLFSVAFVHCRQVSLVASFDVASAAVAEFGPNDAVFLSSFGMLPSQNDIYEIANVSAIFANASSSGINPRLLTKDVKWPNQVSVVPKGELADDAEEYLISAGGFFAIPTQSTGSVDLVRISDGHTTKISHDKSGYFYHTAIWADLNGDGKDDILTARVKKPIVGGSHGELIGLIRPEGDVFSQWEEIVLVEGPDVNFIFVDLDGDEKQEVIAAQAFTAKQLAIYSCSRDTWIQCENGDGVQSVVIDDGIGIVFTVERVDLNGDGREDLLVTGQGPPGLVVAYEQPKNFSTDKWEKHVLASGFKPISSLKPGQGSPGAASAIQSADRKQPDIVLSGDDGGFALLLTPVASSPWKYEQTTICTSTGTIGKIAAKRTDEGLYLAVPFFSEGKMNFYIVQE